MDGRPDLPETPRLCRTMDNFGHMSSNEPRVVPRARVAVDEREARGPSAVGRIAAGPWNDPLGPF